jgi:hypothetical protein
MKNIILFLICAALALPGAAYACSCVAPENLEIEEFADYVFLGEVNSKPWSFSFSQNKYKFSVKNMMLGAKQKEIVIWTDKFTSACGYPYKKGIEYLVIASANGKKYKSGLCSSWPANSEAAKLILTNLAVKP